MYQAHVFTGSYFSFIFTSDLHVFDFCSVSLSQMSPHFLNILYDPHHFDTIPDEPPLFDDPRWLSWSSLHIFVLPNALV